VRDLRIGAASGRQRAGDSLGHRVSRRRRHRLLRLSLARLYERALFVAGAALMIVPRIASDAIGSGHGAAAIASQLVCKVATA
jgi:hypothetical protein